MSDDLNALIARADAVVRYLRHTLKAPLDAETVDDLAAAVRTLQAEKDAIDRYAEELDKAGLLQSEYPEEMAQSSCSCQDDAICGAHRLLARYLQLFKALEDANAKKRSLRAERDQARAVYDTALDVIARLRSFWQIEEVGAGSNKPYCWYLESGMDDGPETDPEAVKPITDAERAVLAAAETRHQDQPR